MDDFRYTEYFEKEVLRKRPYLKKEWCIQVIKNPLKASLRSITGFGSGELLMNSKAAS